ncbi:MAG: hypothetical protein HYU66_26830 [Armatimonadetes bacterium]|nr:hypothetical protein [Armatimonadota bacterium]
MKPIDSLPERLLDVADHLAQWETGRPTEASLRRAVSTGYYGAFHLVLRASYRRLLANARERAELGALAVRDLTHEGVKRLADGARKPPGQRPELVAQFMGSGRLSPDLVSFCEMLVHAQRRREDADYDLATRFRRSSVKTLLTRVRSAFAAWDRIPRAERDRFVLMLLLRARKRTA